MHHILKRFVYADATETTKINPLFHPFLFATLVYSIGFAFLGWWSGVNSSSLYQAMYALHSWLPAIWGVAAFAAVVFATILLLGRKVPVLGEYASLFGTLVWLFAFVVYMIVGSYMVAFSVAIPNLYFWIFYYFKVKEYSRLKHQGLWDDNFKRS